MCQGKDRKWKSKTEEVRDVSSTRALEASLAELQEPLAEAQKGWMPSGLLASGKNLCICE